MQVTINPKQPNLPNCSAILTLLLFRLFSNPALHFIEYMMFDTIIITMKYHIDADKGDEKL